MAFAPYRADPVKFRVAQSAPNPTLQLTGGLARLFKRITEERGSPQHRRNAFTNEEGFLVLSEDLPDLHNRFRARSIIGEGTFSQLVYADDLFSRGRRVAIKVMNTKYEFIGKQESEKLALLNYYDRFSQARIIRFYGAFYFDGHFCMVLEVLGCCLLTHLRASVAMPLEEVRKIAVQLVTAFRFLKRHRIIHADLKPENVLLEGDREHRRRVKLIDFGNAISGKDSASYWKEMEIQTLYYRAPEVLLGLPIGVEIDMWSLGCLLVELFTGQPLFFCKTPKDLFREMCKLLGPLPAKVYESAYFSKRFFNGSNDLDFSTKRHSNESEPRDFVLNDARLLNHDERRSSSHMNSGRNSSSHSYSIDGSPMKRGSNSSGSDRQGSEKSGTNTSSGSSSRSGNIRSDFDSRSRSGCINHNSNGSSSSSSSSSNGDRNGVRTHNTSSVYLDSRGHHVHDLVNNYNDNINTTTHSSYSRHEFVGHSLSFRKSCKEYKWSFHAQRRHNLSKTLKCKDVDFISFLLELLEYNPHDRLTPEQAIRHPFFHSFFPFAFFLDDKLDTNVTEAYAQPPSHVDSNDSGKRNYHDNITPLPLSAKRSHSTVDEQSNTVSWHSYDRPRSSSSRSNRNSNKRGKSGIDIDGALSPSRTHNYHSHSSSSSSSSSFETPVRLHGSYKSSSHASLSASSASSSSKICSSSSRLNPYPPSGPVLTFHTSSKRVRSPVHFSGPGPNSAHLSRASPDVNGRWRDGHQVSRRLKRIE